MLEIYGNCGQNSWLATSKGRNFNAIITGALNGILDAIIKAVITGIQLALAKIGKSRIAQERAERGRDKIKSLF